MIITVRENYGLELKNIYVPITVPTKDGHELIVCERDNGLEVKYGKIWYSLRKGKVTQLSKDE